LTAIKRHIWNLLKYLLENRFKNFEILSQLKAKKYLDREDKTMKSNSDVLDISKSLSKLSKTELLASEKIFNEFWLSDNLNLQNVWGFFIIEVTLNRARCLLGTKLIYSLITNYSSGPYSIAKKTLKFLICYGIGKFKIDSNVKISFE